MTTLSAYRSHNKDYFRLYFGGLSHFPGSPAAMSVLFTWVILLLSFLVVSSSDSCCPPPHFFRRPNQEFEQKTDRFWEFEEKSNSWVEVELPYDLVSCVDGNCTKIGSIQRITKKIHKHDEKAVEVPKKKEHVILPLRKRVSLIKMSETSIWITGQSGSIYERFWNGLQWVIAPHDLPISAGYAISIFMVNQTILALSEAGKIYQMQLSENSQPVWIEFIPTHDQNSNRETEPNSAIQLKSVVLSQDRERIYFCTKNGSLLELSGIVPPRWTNHGRPPGANVAAIADVATVRPEVVFTLSSTGDLYEYSKHSKPSWKKHVWTEGSVEDTHLTPALGCTLNGLSGAHSISLFLLTKGGNLVERRLHQRKWKWIVHGSPEGHYLTSITSVSQDELNEKSFSLFLTTSSGLVYEYQIPKQSGIAQENQTPENWVNHMYPPHAKVARGISGLQLQAGRIIFPLDDGRLGELHLSSLGGENSGPTQQTCLRRKTSLRYVWSILDGPESEGWNAEYCNEERGPSNCIIGIKDELIDAEIARSMRRRKGGKSKLGYLSVDASGSTAKSMEEYNIPDTWINTNFRLRVMQGGRSFFLVTDGGLTFEYLTTENVWFWLRHEHSTAMKGALGNYNGSLFLVDEHGSLLVRERNTNELAWMNCTAMRKGRQVIAGPPWDWIPGRASRVTAEDSLFFVSKSARLLRFSVALRKFKWKDCRSPPNVKIACIIDQEGFRENIVFVVGKNGRLYQYNKVTDLWHEHSQSQHLVLSRLPGTAMRPSFVSLTGSLFMFSEDGGLVEYHWNSLDGWNWVEHGTPSKSVTLVGAPGPCFGGGQLFLVGSDGNVYLRYFDQTIWKWRNYGFPDTIYRVEKDGKPLEEVCTEKDSADNLEKMEENLQAINKNCDPKVTSTRPIPFAEESVIFELRDGRLAEMRRVEDTNWVWSRTIGTPTSICIGSYWTALAS